MIKTETDMYWVPEYNFMDDVTKDFQCKDRVLVYDHTLREGEQTPGVVFSDYEKISIAERLADLGVDFVEMNVTTSDRDFAVAKEIAGGLKKAKLCSLSRRKKADIDKVAAAGCYGIALEGPGNPWLSAQILKSDFIPVRYASFFSQQTPA